MDNRRVLRRVFGGAVDSGPDFFYMPMSRSKNNPSTCIVSRTFRRPVLPFNVSTMDRGGGRCVFRDSRGVWTGGDSGANREPEVTLCIVGVLAVSRELYVTRTQGL